MGILISYSSHDPKMAETVESDAFIVLISKDALKSTPVREEIGQAHYSYIRPTQQARHLDLILSELSGGPRTSKPPGALKDYNKWFPGPYDPGESTLSTPTGSRCSPGSLPRKAEGTLTFYINDRPVDPAGSGSDYRVKAKGGGGRDDSDWSNASGGRAPADEEACATLRSTERRQPWALEEKTCRNLTRRPDAIS